MQIQVTSEELSDIVNALHCKARGDREAAGLLNPTDPPGVQELAKTLIRQAERQEALAERIEE